MDNKHYRCSPPTYCMIPSTKMRENTVEHIQAVTLEALGAIYFTKVSVSRKHQCREAPKLLYIWKKSLSQALTSLLELNKE